MEIHLNKPAQIEQYTKYVSRVKEKITCYLIALENVLENVSCTMKINDVDNITSFFKHKIKSPFFIQEKQGVFPVCKVTT